MLRLANLFPRELNVNGDSGNALALRRRAAWRGVRLEIVPVLPEDKALPDALDGVVIGSGPAYVLEDLQSSAKRLALGLRGLMHNQAPFLAVAGGWQLLSRGWTNSVGQSFEGAGVFPTHLAWRAEVSVGERVISSSFGRLVGFENHSMLIKRERGGPLGQVLPEAGDHGFFDQHLLATTLHGAFLPLNPVVADWFLETMQAVKGVSEPLAELCEAGVRIDRISARARKSIAGRLGFGT